MAITRQYIVTVEAETKEQVDQVMAERLNPDEDYGFAYEVGYYGVGTIHAILDTETVRQDWPEDPHLDDAAVTALSALSDEVVDACMADQVLAYEDEHFAFLDSVRGAVTLALLEDLGMTRGPGYLT